MHTIYNDFGARTQRRITTALQIHMTGIRSRVSHVRGDQHKCPVPRVVKTVHYLGVLDRYVVFHPQNPQLVKRSETYISIATNCSKLKEKVTLNYLAFAMQLMLAAF